MDLHGWDKRYRLEGANSPDLDIPASELLVRTAGGLQPGRALDLACGSGRNTLWLAARGWRVTAVDGSPAALDVLRRRSNQSNLIVDARLADLEAGQFEIAAASWDLIAMSYYLQRDLFAPAKRGLAPGGLLLAIVHLCELGEEPTGHRVRPGELGTYFAGWEILHLYEGPSHDATHQRAVAEIVARR